MISSRKFTRLKTSENLPVLVLAVSVIIVIQLCNMRDEKTANQYIIKDDGKRSSGSCELYPSTLLNNVPIDMSSELTWTDVENECLGGIYTPSDCTSRQQLAVIIPFRYREKQLQMLLRHLHPFLQRQKRAYRVFVVEQYGNGTFNKGLIMNVAFNYASKIISPLFDCFIFHDVDLIPENDYNVYECEQQGPRHLAPAVDELRYFLMYNDLIGGVLALTKEQFFKANGWSNLYWGWGFEDDDMNHRLRHAGYRISRPPNRIGRYKMIRHKKQTPATNRYGTLSKWLRYSYDGVRQLSVLDYSVASVETRPLYTHILVNFTRSATKTIDHLQYKDSRKSSRLCYHYISTIVFTIIHFIFVLAYNKILPWEIGLVVLFLLLILHYAQRLGASLFKSDLTWLPIGIHQEHNPNVSSIVVTKFLVSSLLLFGYTCQLCLTTVCTPSIYFNWFLIVTDCRYTYTNLLSSYTFAGGILVLLTWTIILVLHIILQKMRP
ncbi:unnamed protein product [Adineta ricciae]|uniref:Beta-1,4-galactosyltransferase n=1 Tax=Adineta ricciae TaxID=249248 RepID=A0A814YG37_ADIRI|nr:unnamed protein product [Adineta ricciae]